MWLNLSTNSDDKIIIWSLRRLIIGISQIITLITMVTKVRRVIYNSKLVNLQRFQTFEHLSQHYVVFRLASRRSCLAMMPLLLCGTPNCRSSFVECDTFGNHNNFEGMIKVGSTPPNLGRLILAHAVPFSLSNCYTIMLKGLIYWCK